MSWRIKRGTKDEVIMVFSGRLSTAEGIESARAFCDAAGNEGDIDAVWDIRLMAGYDSGARVAWQSALGPLRSRFVSIRVVGGNALVRLGASTLGLVLGIPLSFVDRWDEDAAGR